MKLEHTILREKYWHAKRNQVVELIVSDPIDGSSLIVEPLDDRGDIMGGDCFRCEASQLEPVTREIWERQYPPSDPDNVPYQEPERRSLPVTILVKVAEGLRIGLENTQALLSSHLDPFAETTHENRHTVARLKRDVVLLKATASKLDDALTSVETP